MGIVIGIGQTKPQMPYDQFYGIEWDVTVSNPKAKRIGKLELHASLPVQSLMRRCVLRDNGEVAYYLDANDSTKKEGGAPAKLDGTDGQVMVEVPAFYVKFEAEGNKRRCLISLHNLPGFTKWEKLYVSAYEATVQRSTNKLSSVVNATADFRGGDNDASKDSAFNTMLGRPATNLTIEKARAYAGARGSARWCPYTYQAHKELFWLFAVEYCTFNSQEGYSAALDEQGCRIGGLGNSATNIRDWNVYGYSAVVKCGATNELGNSTGVVPFNSSAPGQTSTIEVPAYRGVELPFGHISKIVDGVAIDGSGNVYTASDPNSFGGELSKYKLVGAVSSGGGYVKDIMLGDGGEIIAKMYGGGSSVYFCDRQTVSPNSQVVVSVGGAGNNVREAGFLCVNASRPAFHDARYLGTRLCYLP